MVKWTSDNGEVYYCYTTSRNEKIYYSDPEGTVLHRPDGPALILESGSSFWYKNNELHRLDGPAEEYRNFTRHITAKGWYVNGKRINCNNQKEFKKLMKLKAFW